ncbi:hypothetical protein O6H91_02G068400 [Diphasiastrum complanatum]|uniref:Uncharacterized protein n=1 Tax=Diphasiastrum complanatum TaxID=34168 RepID=A0ACC2EGN1_DIPCM|nr:hypothetical protein O6H91_Y525300 [Diphasiastrum complanatum]KAJ7565636.1 hypothetical protein O6H91_02G068400 [Diphasiastrum complanatum]
MQASSRSSEETWIEQVQEEMWQKGIIRRNNGGLRRSVMARFSDLHNGPDTLEGLLDEHLLTAKRAAAMVDEEQARRRLTTTRREVFSLYRDVLRACRLFLWTNEKGVPWREVLRVSAREEFENTRHEKDPEVIARLLVVGRDSLEAAIDKMIEKQQQMLKTGPTSHSS